MTPLRVVAPDGTSAFFADTPSFVAWFTSGVATAEARSEEAA